MCACIAGGRSAALALGAQLGLAPLCPSFAGNGLSSFEHSTPRPQLPPALLLHCRPRTQPPPLPAVRLQPKPRCCAWNQALLCPTRLPRPALPRYIPDTTTRKKHQLQKGTFNTVLILIKGTFEACRWCWRASWSTWR